MFQKDKQFYKFCTYGFLKNLKFFEPFLILFFLEQGLSFFEVGLLYSVREIATNLLEIPTGIVADFSGRRRAMIFAFCAYIISFLIFYLTRGFLFYLPAMLLFACGEAFRTGTHKAMIYSYLKLKGWQKEKVDYYGHTRSSSQAGAAVSALLSALIVFASRYYRPIFLFSIIPYVADLFLMLSYPRVLDGKLPERKPGWIKARFRHFFTAIMVSFRRKGAIRVVANLSVFSGYFKAVKDFLQPVLKSYALTLPLLLSLKGEQRSAILVGIVYALIYSLTSIATRKAGALARSLKSEIRPLNGLIIAGCLLMVIGALCFNLNWEGVTILCFLGLFLVQNLRKPIGLACVSDLVEEEVLATALSIESQVTTLTAALIAPLLGGIADWLGLGYGLLAASLLVLLLSPLFLLKRQSEN